MNAIKLGRRANTPELNFSPANGTFSMEGECYPENANVFFSPIFSIITRYLETMKPASFVARIRLEYVNSASTKSFRQLFGALHSAAVAGCNVDIEWEFDTDDYAMRDLGQDLMYSLGATPMIFKEVPLMV